MLTQLRNSLDRIVGTWTSHGRTVARDEEQPVEIIGTDAYEWLAGGHFLLHRVDVRMGQEHVEVLEVIGGSEEPGDGGVPMRSFDNLGNTGTMRATAHEDGSLSFTGDSERAHLVVAEDGNTMSARWERADGSRWQHWMDMSFSRAVGRSERRSR